MQKIANRATAILVALTLTAVAMVPMAMADKDDGKVHKGDEKTIYINAGVMGDVGIICTGTIGLTVPATIEGTVTVNDPTTGGEIDSVGTGPVGIPIIGGQTIVPDTEPNVCTGGAFGDHDFDGTEEYWEVWVHDYIWNGMANTRLDPPGGPGVEDLLGLSLKSAFFARIQTTYVIDVVDKGHPDANQDCVMATAVPGWTGTDVCLRTPSGTVSAFRNTHNFGGCGQAAIEMDHSVLDPSTNSQPPMAGAAVSNSKQVFVDGPLGYALDCQPEPIGAEDIRDEYRNAAQLVNSVTCPNVVCIFEELPAAGSQCQFDKNEANPLNIAVPGLIGEVGWRFTDDPGCVEPGFHDDWGQIGPGLFTLVLKNSPVEVSIE